MKRFLWKGILLLVMGVSVSSQAQSSVGFQTPSKNIHCFYIDDSQEPALRCDVGGTGDFAWILPQDGSKKPAKEEATDTIANPNHPILEYGKSWKKGAAIVCQSAPSTLSI